MSTRRRSIVGLGLAVAVGLIGPSLAAVATHTGNGYAAIRGTVTNESGAPLQGICVTAYHYNAFWRLEATEAEAGFATTAADGSYAIGRLTNDDYRVKFEQCQDAIWERTHRSEWYDDQILAEDASKVSIRYNADANGIDAALATVLP